MHTIDNPFQQNSVTYCLELQIKFAYLQFFLQFFETLSETIVYFEDDYTKNIDSKPEDIWRIQVYLDKKPNLKVIEAKTTKIALEHKIPPPCLEVKKINDKDWVSEVQKTFIPIQSGLFFIHHSNYDEEIPEGQIAIEINAGRAFGTGEHETTSNCLKALSNLKENKYINCLDMGCGSGILAIAMAKLWPYQITAVDVDEQAINVALENFHLNGTGFITAEQSDGYKSKFVSRNAPYQLITANILANPLIEMAHDAYVHLQEGGILILAGFLNDQIKNVLKAHKKQGFNLVQTISDKNWPILILKK
ncbi:MAG: 50S ribosomal protein L11 methyltransferase [Rickettsiales bacterium]|jgi:ribosomal protein L11 methyltransferase|nr:50S ribosomal protein L11 methyltransferase [Rickettsiales bacterium]